MLRRNWYTKNYVAYHFMRSLPRFAAKLEWKEKLIDGLIAGVQNDAMFVKHHLSMLPHEWSEQIHTSVGIE